MGLSFDKNPQVRNRILCAYCHLFHLTEDLVNGLCPKFAPYALELQKEHSYECAACGGEGSFERRTETKILENQKKYE
jgi:DNA-directed RNA polymerase subunit RPC12/RpoP